MVFCYKIITESPRRSRCTSPRKGSPTGRYSSALNTVSELINSYDYETNQGDVWDEIPEREWKLLAALARKREEETERERLAEQFQKMWLKEKEERDMVAAETSGQYKKYLQKKRNQERWYNDYRRLQKTEEQLARRDQLLYSIQHKEQRSADLLAWKEDRRITELIGKAVEEECRAQLAAERRHRRGVAEEWRKRLQLVHDLQRTDDAVKRRNALLRDASQRLAINNALSTWETSLIRQEVQASEAAKRAHTAAYVALKETRGIRLTRAKETRRQKARRVAALTAQMRETIKSGR